MAIYVANNGQLQTVKGIYYASENYINATLFHNLVPKTATVIKFLYAYDNPDLTDYQRIGYCDNNNFIEVWNKGTKYIIINPRNNYIYAPVSCDSFFYKYALTNCVFDNFDTRNVTDMSRMFYYCRGLTSLDLSSFNTEKVTDMQYMFRDCTSLTSLDISSFNTKNVTNMKYMFSNCRLTSLDLSNFNTQNVTNYALMFYFDTNLQTLNISSFDFGKGKLLNSMFHNCTKLQNLILPQSFNNVRPTSLEAMFNSCLMLMSVTLQDIDTSSVKSFYLMFNKCKALRTIVADTFTIKSSNNTNMFDGCDSLVGGNGTTYSSSHIKAEYARVDGENNLPGYFTAPNN